MSDNDSAEFAGNLKWAAEHGYGLVMVLLPQSDGTATINIYGPIDAESRAVVEANAGLLLSSTLMTAEAAAAAFAAAPMPTIMVDADA